MGMVILFFNYANFSKYFEELSYFGIVFLQDPTSFIDVCKYKTLEFYQPILLYISTPPDSATDRGHRPGNGRDI